MALAEPSGDPTARRPAVLEVAGEEVGLDPSGALWLGAAQALVAADLHLEKGSAFAARGALLPPYDTAATLGRLAALIAAYAPRLVVCLGDSFHDRETDARMAGCDRAALAALVGSVAGWVWIAGNHDPAPPAGLGGTALPELRLGALTLRHEPRAGRCEGEVAGHLHPCARIVQRGRSVRRRCFASEGSRLVLPAFGVYAGGLNLRDGAFAPIFPNGALAYMLGQERVWPISPRRQLCD